LKRFQESFALVAMAVLFTALLTACGSSNNNNSSSPVSLRFVNASRSASLTVSLNGTIQFSGVAAGSTTGYASVGSGEYTITVISASGSLASWTLTTGLGAGNQLTLFAYDRDGAVLASLVTEGATAPPSGYAMVQVSNLSPDSGALDVFLVSPGTTTLLGLTPTFSSAAYLANPAFTTLVVGTFDIVATATGNSSDVRFKLPSVAITNGQILTAAFTSTSGGALVNGVLMNQGGTVQFVPAANARVRAVSALPVSGASLVAATVGGTALGSVFSPNPGTYTLVPGGTSSYSITVSGTAIATLPAASFATGGDFTILVYGAAASPSVSIFTDNNQVPAGSNANLRLVNAAVNVAGGLTLYDNNVQVASSVGYGNASSYFGVAESATSTLELIEPSVAPVIDTPVSIDAPQAVYTVFVIDSTLTPYLIRDR
jgi:Domain of unknown function (DUF4397)